MVAIDREPPFLHTHIRKHTQSIGETSVSPAMMNLVTVKMRTREMGAGETNTCTMNPEFQTTWPGGPRS